MTKTNIEVNGIGIWESQIKEVEETITKTFGVEDIEVTDFEDATTLYIYNVDGIGFGMITFFKGEHLEALACVEVKGIQYNFIEMEELMSELEKYGLGKEEEDMTEKINFIGRTHLGATIIKAFELGQYEAIDSNDGNMTYYIVDEQFCAQEGMNSLSILESGGEIVHVYFSNNPQGIESEIGQHEIKNL